VTDLLLNLADAVAPSRANGPGARAVLWAQGCSLRCRGCHNPQTWEKAPRRVCTASAAAAWVRSFPGLRGLTLSGGEPFEQALGFTALCRALRAEGADVIAFSGFSRDEIASDVRPHARALLAEVDLLIDGRYEAPLAARLPLRG
jgi:anaerobic ribonucleoside-triphosphate reductase activating protein